MKRRSLFLLLLPSMFLITATTCEDEFEPPTYEEERADLDRYKASIEEFAADSVCTGSTECMFIAFGSKPCGGPVSYLVYTSSIDTDQLELWVSDYNQLEEDLNTRYDIISDCAAVEPPSGFDCENNRCIPLN